MTALAGAQAPPAALSVRVETGASCRVLFDGRWDDLLRRQPLPNPLLSATWLQHLADLEEGQPVAIVVERDGAIVAAGAFGLYRPAGRLGPTLARWLGDHRQWCSPDLLVDHETPAAGEAVVDTLLGLCDAVHLPAAEHGAAHRALRSRIPWLVELPGQEGWTAPLPTPRDEEAWKRYQTDCRRAVRRGAEKIELRPAASPDEVAPALERLFVIHAERWRTRGGEIPRFSTTEAHRDWYRRVVAAMAERGDVLISELHEDGELFASSLAFVAGRGAAAHTTAVRVGGRLKEPGRASQLHLCRALEDTGVEAIDLGPGACEPGSPKSGLGPTRHVVPRFLAAGSRRSQRAVNTALAVRARVRGSRR